MNEIFDRGENARYEDGKRDERKRCKELVLNEPIGEVSEHEKKLIQDYRDSILNNITEGK